MSASSIVCPRCRRRSYHPSDIEHRFCRACGYHDDLPSPLRPRDVATAIGVILSEAAVYRGNVEVTDPSERYRALAHHIDSTLGGPDFRYTVLVLPSTVEAWLDLPSEVRRDAWDRACRGELQS